MSNSSQGRRRRSSTALRSEEFNDRRRSSVFNVGAMGGLQLLGEDLDMSESESNSNLFPSPLIDASMSDSEKSEEDSIPLKRASFFQRRSSAGSKLQPLVEDEEEEEEEVAKEEEKPKPSAVLKASVRKLGFLSRLKAASKKPQPAVIEEETEEQKPVVEKAPSARQGMLSRMMSKRHSARMGDESGRSKSKRQPLGEIQNEMPPPSHEKYVPSNKMLDESASSVDSEDEQRRISFIHPHISKRNSTNYTPMNVKAALKNAPASKWKVETTQFSGRFDCKKCGKWEEVRGKRIDKGIKKFKANPEKYYAITYQKSMRFMHDTKRCSYTLIHREGTRPITPLDVGPNEKMIIMMQTYQHLKPFPNDELPPEHRDPWTTDLTFDGEKLPKPLLPGRGMGAGDMPNLKIIGDIDPADITQGDIGNCWLLSAISALAEFDGAIKKLFRKTKDLDYMPMNKPNKYTITLYDLETWEEVDIEIDEGLCAHPSRKGDLLGAQISEDGELWVSYLEKAFIIHCGAGWDGLNGGHCTHAFSMMTGCKEQYFIRKNNRTSKYYCSAKFDMFTREWKKLHNLPRHEDTAGLEPVPWPEVGGGGGMGSEFTKDELFLKMYAWDQENYIVGASSKGSLEEDTAAGLVQNHAYSVIDAFHNVAGTGVDMFKVRNPWGHGEPDDAMFSDTGPGWEKYPQIKAELNPVVADDGIFYLTKDEFFEFFDHIFLSASNMTEFKED